MGAGVWLCGPGDAIEADEHTPYGLASVTKPVAATVVMQLIEEGLIGLDDPAADYGVSVNRAVTVGAAVGCSFHRTCPAIRLGEFVAAMRSIQLPGESSTNRRGRHQVDGDPWTRTSIAAVAEEFDPHLLTAVWERALAQPPWDGTPAWIHGDLMPGNLVVDHGELRAVLDFGECALGNPTLDLIAGWWVFAGESRHAFRRSANPDEASWNRARGWALALSGAVGALAYYVDTNPAFSDLARKTIRNVIADGEGSMRA